MKYKIVTVILIAAFCLVSTLGLVSAQQTAATVKGEADAPSFQLYPKRIELVPGEGCQIKMTASTPSIYSVETLTVSIIYPSGWYWDTSIATNTYVIEGTISDNPIILSMAGTLPNAITRRRSVTDWISFTCPIGTSPRDYEIIAVANFGYTDIATGRALTSFGRQDVVATVTSTAAIGEAKKTQQQVEQANAKIIEAQGKVTVVDGMLSQAKADGKDVTYAESTLSQAKASLQLARTTVNSNPTTALANAESALAQAQTAENMILQAKKKGLSTEVLIGIAVVAIVIVGVGVVFLTRKKK